MRELQAADVPALQAFFDPNPLYFLNVNGQVANANEAREEFDSRPPESFPYSQTWVLGFMDGSDRMVALAGVVSDLFAPSVWHIGLFIVATALHGRGAAGALYGPLEQWIRASGRTGSDSAWWKATVAQKRSGARWAAPKCASARAWSRANG